MTDYDEEFDTQFDVEQNPCGAWQAIQELTADRDRYKARAERAEKALKGMLNHVQDEVFAKGLGEVYQADIGPAVDASRATLAQINAESAEPRQPTVKPLQWVKDGDRHHAGYYVIEDTSYGQREVRRLLRASFNSTYVADFAGHNPLEQAKAAAQADYERRILSAIEYRQPTVQEAARVLLSDKTAAHELAINLMRRHKKTKGTEKGGYYPALCYALRALAEGDSQ